MQTAQTTHTETKAPEYTPPQGLVKVDGKQFENFIKGTRCTEHFVGGATHYLETGTRTLVALFHQRTGGCYTRPRHLRVAK